MQTFRKQNILSIVTSVFIILDSIHNRKNFPPGKSNKSTETKFLYLFYKKTSLDFFYAAFLERIS